MRATKARRAISQSNRGQQSGPSELYPIKQLVVDAHTGGAFVPPSSSSSLASPLREKSVVEKVTVEVVLTGRRRDPESARLAKNVAYPTTLLTKGQKATRRRRESKVHVHVELEKSKARDTSWLCKREAHSSHITRWRPVGVILPCF